MGKKKILVNGRTFEETSRRLTSLYKKVNVGRGSDAFNLQAIGKQRGVSGWGTSVGLNDGDLVGQPFTAHGKPLRAVEKVSVIALWRQNSSQVNLTHPARW